MAITTTWTSPAEGGSLDLATGGTIIETIWEGVLSNLNRLGGTAGNRKTGGYVVDATDVSGAAQAWKDGSVNHGMTSFDETDTYGAVQIRDANVGGALYRGFTEGTVATVIQGFATSDGTAKTSAATGYVIIEAIKKNGAGGTNPGANANILVVRDGSAGNAKFIVDQEGDTFQDGTAGTAFDSYEDSILAYDLSQVLAGRPDRVQRYDRNALAEIGILHVSGDGRPFVSSKKRSMVLLGAVGQLFEYNKALERIVQKQGERIRALEQRLGV